MREERKKENKSGKVRNNNKRKQNSEWEGKKHRDLGKGEGKRGERTKMNKFREGMWKSGEEKREG